MLLLRVDSPDVSRAIEILCLVDAIRDITLRHGGAFSCSTAREGITLRYKGSATLSKRFSRFGRAAPWNMFYIVQRGELQAVPGRNER